ncbi:MAG: hypothetical protein IT337_13460, partial [Thermomicrobiales bacterium]|nr:hypothetical protein [Thermomicrobiales bacterium]
HGDRAVLLELPAPDAETEAAVLTLLRARGFAPLPDGGSARRTSGGVE